jgi:hypothetical protein
MPFLFIVTSLVMWTLVSAYGGASQVQNTSNASSQVTLAFMTLDDEVRYAADINLQGQYSSNYYVEFESDWTQNTTPAESTCTGLEYDNSTGQLLQRSWLINASPPTGWQVLASGLQTSISTDPFTVLAPGVTGYDQGSPFQLSVTLSALSGAGSSKGTAQSSFTITALDTTENSVDTGVCQGTPS